MSFSFARRNGVIPPQEDFGPALYREGAASEALLELRRYLGRPVRFEQLSVEAFEKRLQEVYEQQSGEAGQIAADLGDDLDLSQLAQELPQSEELLDSNDDAPIIRLLNALFSQAIRERASDIHIEPYENRVSVRIRVDGVLREVLRAERRLAPLVASRVKVMARLDIAEKRLPQDGRISLKIAGRGIDVRVSTLPSSHGERVVLRLLDRQAAKLDLEELGMPPVLHERFSAIIRKPHGIVLVTGPTGSGKTTTLYAALTRLNEIDRNIMTVEDPIEYDLDGVSQSQVNAKAELSFAKGLRAILRQDPDVVMVGEIRDYETAQIAVQASLTGHLVFSTLHTNTAIGAVTRLRDMGVEPFLLSSSLLGVLAQRLVRVLCAQCREPYTPDENERELLGLAVDSQQQIHRAVGCEHCQQRGYRGRTGIYEFIVVDDMLSRLIHDGAGEQEMLRHLRQNTPSMLDDGRRNVLAGITSLDEVLRVTREG